MPGPSALLLPLVLALGGGADPPDDPAALVAALAAPAAADRDAAAGRIEELGRPALPALYGARGSDDADVRRRAETLIDLVERQRLLRPTRVRLDFADATLGAVAEAIGARTGLSVVVPDEALRARVVTLTEPEPLPFWTALDRVARAGAARHRPAAGWTSTPREAAVEILDGPPPDVPTWDDGPFRVQLVRISRHVDTRPGRAPGTATLSATIQVFAEPGLAAHPIGRLVVAEAIDDAGRDRRPEPPLGRSPSRTDPPRLDDGLAGLFPLELPLRPLDDAPGARLRRLRGRVAIAVRARAGDPLVLPLDEAGDAAPWRERGGRAVRIVGTNADAGGMAVRVQFRGEPPPQRFPSGLAGTPSAYEPPYRVEDHVRALDARDAPLRLSASPPRALADGGTEVTLSVAGGPPSRLLYHHVVAAATELVFRFDDIPLP
jgi:hypothetical protein